MSPTELFEREALFNEKTKRQFQHSHYPVLQKKRNPSGIVAKFGNPEFADTLPSETLWLAVSTLIAVIPEKSIHSLHLEEI